MIITRPIRLPADATAVDALDRTFTTTVAYEVRRRPDTGGLPASVELVGPVATPPRTKRYEMTPREGGLVARRRGVTVGYAHVEYAQWNRRAEIGDFYVAATARRSGVGAALMAAVMRRARLTPARCLWLETQDVNGDRVLPAPRIRAVWLRRHALRPGRTSRRGGVVLQPPLVNARAAAW